MGVILDVEVTTGQTNEGDIIEPQVDEVGRTTGVRPKAVTADAGYAYAKVYAAFEKRGIDAVIPAKAEPIRSRVPLRRLPAAAENAGAPKTDDFISATAGGPRASTVKPSRGTAWRAPSGVVSPT